MVNPKGEPIRTVSAAALVLAVLFSPVWTSGAAAAEVASDPRNLPGMQTGPMPWNRETDNLFSRLQALGLPALSAEGNKLHIHQHLDLVVNGTPVVIPAGIGINEFARFISQIHTHDDSGVIHVESDEVRDFTLGQFFDIWGIRFTKECVGGYCNKGSSALKVFSNGKPVSGDPRSLALRSHQEIAVIYGPPKSVRSIPSSYAFGPGL